MHTNLAHCIRCVLMYPLGKKSQNKSLRYHCKWMQKSSLLGAALSPLAASSDVCAFTTPAWVQCIDHILSVGWRHLTITPLSICLYIKSLCTPHFVCHTLCCETMWINLSDASLDFDVACTVAVMSKHHSKCLLQMWKMQKIQPDLCKRDWQNMRSDLLFSISY